MVNQPATEPMSLIQPIDREALRRSVRSATPFPNFLLDNFLEPAFAEEVLAAFPTFEQAAAMGMTFKAVNEKNKIQVTDASKFPEAIARLDQALSAPEFRELLAYAFDLPELYADPNHVGGGMHQTGARGHLDVHVDFNFDEALQMHRRLNILVYFNKDWDPEWGGNIELWDRDMKRCVQSFSPVFNRCVVFATSEISNHGVTAVKCPEDRTRKSFAAYYYTKEAPEGWDGQVHSTIFKARPDEKLKGHVLMPLEKTGRQFRNLVNNLKQTVKKVVKR